jgi:hypothetical protein
MRKEIILNARALPSRSWDLTLSRQNGGVGRLLVRPSIPAPESALRSLPSVAVPYAQVTAILNPTSGVGSEFTLNY